MAPKKEDKPVPGIVPKAVKLGDESLMDRIVPHIKKILVTVVLVAVAVSVILVIRWRGEVKKEHATAKLLDVLDVARREVGPEAPVLPDAKPPAKKPDPKFATQKDRAEAVLAALTSSGAAATSSYKGALLMDAGKVDEAIAEYRSGQGAPDVEGVLCREGLGIALETKAIGEKDAATRQRLLEEALATFQAMQPAEDGPRRAYALYHQGRMQQILGKTAEAKTLFEQAKTAGASSSELAQLIDKRLASLGAS
jgi:tetratricopeptide (TPR) repeat protein